MKDYSQWKPPAPKGQGKGHGLGPDDPRLKTPPTRHSYAGFTKARPDYKPRPPIFKVRRWDNNRVIHSFQGDTTFRAVVEQALTKSLPLDYAKLTGSYLWGLTTPEKPCSFEHTHFNEANLADSKWNTCLFKRTDFRGANLGYAVFRGCNFDGVDFDGANLHRTLFYKCLFNNCSFHGDNEKVYFKYCKIQDSRGLDRLTQSREHRALFFKTEIVASV